MAVPKPASGAQHALRYVPELEWGTTPASPVMVALRHTSCGLVHSKDAFQSNELRDDRQIAALRLGANKVSGPVAFEWSFGEYDPFLEAALCGTWTSDVLKAGTSLKSFTIERKFGEINQYQKFSGCCVNELSLDIKPNAIVTGSLDIVGKGSSIGGTPLDADVTASQGEAAFDSFSGALYEGGTQIAVITGLTLSLKNAMEPQFVVGSADASFVSMGRSTLTGEVSAFFTDTALLSKFRDETETSLRLRLGGATKAYELLLPRIKFTGASNPTDGEGPMKIAMPFTALLDPTEATNIKLTRIPA